jgi:hypothetical protein
MTIGLFIVGLILASVVTFMLESMPSFKSHNHCASDEPLCQPQVDSPALAAFEEFVIIVSFPQSLFFGFFAWCILCFHFMVMTIMLVGIQYRILGAARPRPVPIIDGYQPQHRDRL